jgi:iron complex transport system substrate-binding protein
MKLPVGLLVHFGCDTLKEGVKRVVNNHEDLKAFSLYSSATSAPLREQKLVLTYD